MTKEGMIAMLVGAMALFDGCSHPSRQAAQPNTLGPDWVLDPKIAGPDLPPAGRSLFDHVVGSTPPFPFPALLKQVEEQLGPVRLRRVLIPLGRSLQRSIASPEFFPFPRAVAMADSEPPARLTAYLKDRLFLAYQEKANVIEVLSYNEAAGRFEFQLVTDYREGGSPRIAYARRTVCTVCHQNQAPIFPKQLWDETNGNPKISRLLRAQGRDYYDFPIAQSADVPYQIDNAVHRANELSAFQLLWREGAGNDPEGPASIRLRARWLAAILQYRLSGSRVFDSGTVTQQELVKPLRTHWSSRWPRGLAIPNPEIPNRNPLSPFSRGGPSGEAETIALLVEEQKKIDPSFEPAAARPPLDVWRASDDEAVERAITGLSSFLAEDDIRWIEGKLMTTPAPAVRFPAFCVGRNEPADAQQIHLHCTLSPAGPSAGFALDGTVHVQKGAAIDGNFSLQPDAGRALRNLEATAGTLALQGNTLRGDLRFSMGGTNRPARLPDGRRIAGLHLESGTATLSLVDDFAEIRRAIAAMESQTQSGAFDAFSSKPFRRVSVLRPLFLRLNIVQGEWCCLKDGLLPPPQLEATRPH